jgi:hypothetical protein
VAVRFRRGNNASLPAGGTVGGEPRFSVDTNQLYVDNGSVNVEVTPNATNVEAAGAVMKSQTATTGYNFVVNENDLVSNSATKVPTQSSVRAYVLAAIAGLTKSNVGLSNVTNNAQYFPGGTDVAITDGGTGASDAATARANLGAWASADVVNENDLASNSAAKVPTQSSVKSYVDTSVATVTSASTHAAASKTTPVDADEIPLSDSAATFGLKKLTWANLKAALGIADKAEKITIISAGTGLLGGGNLSASRTLTVSYGTTAGTSAQGNDARLSDTRTPTDGSVTAAKIPDGTITSAKIADGAIVDADINASAAIALTKLATGRVTGSVNGTATNLTLWTGTAAQYAAIGSKDPNTLYAIT